MNLPDTIFALWDSCQQCFVASCGPFPALTEALKAADQWNAIHEITGRYVVVTYRLGDAD